MSSVITGVGSYIPSITKKNSAFFNAHFYTDKNRKIDTPNPIIIDKFKAITGIEERRYAPDNMDSSDLATLAAQKAIAAAGIDPEELDYIILAQNFGNVKKGEVQSDFIPSLASRVKHDLRIKNSSCVAYDIIFGCPGWIEGLIQADTFIKAGMAKKCLVIGSETLSRVVDEHDRDAMIYSDGAGACILEAQESTTTGILSHATATHTYDEAHYLFFGKSNKPEADQNIKYIKMYGRKIYEFALNNVPTAMKSALDKSGIDIKNLKKIFIHQANEKMDEAIIDRFYQLYSIPTPKDIMPMSIRNLGNSSVATIPTLLDLVLQNKIQNHQLHKGDIIMFASVGAGMNINAVIYRY